MSADTPKMVREALCVAQTAHPARVLREVEAKREILDEHARQEVESPLSGPKCCRCVKEMHGWQEDWSAQEYPCRTLHLLASVYVDHSDYDPSWAVE